MILAAFWPAGLAACAAWLAGAALSRRSSVGALAAFAAAPAAALAWGRPAVAALLLLIAALVYMRHSANIRRLIAGTEPRIGRSA